MKLYSILCVLFILCSGGAAQAEAFASSDKSVLAILRPVVNKVDAFIQSHPPPATIEETQEQIASLISDPDFVREAVLADQKFKTVAIVNNKIGPFGIANFDRVTPNIFRSAIPSQGQIDNLTKTDQVDSVISVRTTDAPKKAAKDSNLEAIPLGTPNRTLQGYFDVLERIQALRNESKIVLFYDDDGKQQSGLLALLLTKLNQKRPLSAEEQRTATMTFITHSWNQKPDTRVSYLAVYPLIIRSAPFKDLAHSWNAKRPQINSYSFTM